VRGVDHPPVEIAIEGEVDEMNYPINAITDLLYRAIDDLQKMESKHDVDVPFPIKRRYTNTFGDITVHLMHTD
jgi:hypothetical protein